MAQDFGKNPHEPVQEPARPLSMLEKIAARVPRFWRWSVALLCSASMAIIANWLSEGEGYMIVLSLFIIVVIGMLIHVGRNHAEQRQATGLYWCWISCSLVFFSVLIFCKILIVKEFKIKISAQEYTLSNFTNILVETNEFYRDQISGLRMIANGSKQTTYSVAALMGQHDYTNFINSTNWYNSTNIINTTNLITVGDQSNTSSGVPYVLDFFQMQRLRAKLENVPRMPIVILCHPDDPDGIIIARQIAQLFLSAGFQIKASPYVTFKFPFNGITVAFKKRPVGPINDFFMQLFGEIGQTQNYDTEADAIPSDEIWITVAKNQK